MGVEIVHRVDRLGVHVPARVTPARVDREPQVPLGVADVLVEAGAVDRGGRVADRAVVVQGRLDEVVAARAGHPVRGHRLADIGREGRVLDVVAGRDQVLHLVVEEGEVPHPVDVVAEREHAVVGAERPQPGPPERLEPGLEEQAAQEEEERVAPVGGVRPVTDRLDVQVGLEHAAHELEHLVGDVRGAVGEHDRGAQGSRGGGGRAGQIPGELDQLGQDAAARRGRDPLDRVARRSRSRRAAPRPAPPNGESGRQRQPV